MSPQVSRPRRRLPTGMSSTLRSWMRRNSTSDAAVAAVSLSRVPAGVLRSLLDRRQDLRLFLAPMPFSERSFPAFAAAPRSSMLLMFNVE